MSSPLAGRRVLLGVTGGIAAYKSAELVRRLRERGAEVQAVMTPAATRFVGPDTFAALTGRTVHSEVFERTEAVLHVRLARWAEVAVVAPATANVVAKLALGLADDLLTSTLLEFQGPLVVAAAMHSGMYGHPATEANLTTLGSRGVRIVGPVAGPLAAGDEGMGRMAEPEEIADAVENALGVGVPYTHLDTFHELDGRRILVTAGPTHEPIDAVRFVGNRSSGKMGIAVAREAASRGAVVTLVLGPTQLQAPKGVEVVRVETAEEMRRAVEEAYDDADAVVMTAAVSDFRPTRSIEGKLKKDAGPPTLLLEPTTDILGDLGRRKGGRILVGFAAETEDLEAEAERKRKDKNLDLVVVNRVGAAGTGFESDTNEAMILGGGPSTPLRLWSKSSLAAEICDRVSALLRPA